MVAHLSVESIDPKKLFLDCLPKETQRDFFYLYWYCLNREPLFAVIERALAQYPGQKHNVPHILKSLTYFADAEEDPMPQIFFDATWSTVKKYFQKEVPRITREILELK